MLTGVFRSTPSHRISSSEDERLPPITTALEQIKNAHSAPKWAGGMFLTGSIIVVLAHFLGEIDATTAVGCEVGVIAAVTLLILMSYSIYKSRRSIPSYEEAQKYGYKLKPGQFFSYQGGKIHDYKKMLMLYHPDKDIGLAQYFYSRSYKSFKQNYTEISLKELENEDFNNKV